MRCLFTCRHLLNSSDLLFKMFFLRPLRISNFSSRQRRHFLGPVPRVGICLMMSHAIVYSRLLSFRFQTCLDSSVSFLYFLLLRDLQWFRYLVLKLSPVTPRTYIGVTGDNFKTRYRNHCKSLNNRKYKNETELSKHVWNLKDNKCEYTIAWDIIRQIPTRGTGPRKCRLCLEEKLLILKGRRKNILNKRSELFNKCRHVNKHLTWAHVTCK